MRASIQRIVAAADAAEVAAWAARYEHVVVDLGTGDGRSVLRLARERPAIGAVGIDLCEANLRRAARAAGDNTIFLVADALALPATLARVADAITVAFPWGSLLRGLLNGDPGLLAGLRALGRPGATISVSVNGGAFAEAGWDADTGGERIRDVLGAAGFEVGACRVLGPAELRQLPSTWAKRLAFGRDPRAVRIEARLIASAVPDAGALLPTG